jgi:hypothetical protein
MTALSDFATTVRAWVDDLNPSDTLIASWVRIAEERMNNELRVDEMIAREYASFDDNCTVLPENWLKTLYVKPQGGSAYTFISNHAYFGGELTDCVLGSGRYTNVGRTLFIWPPVDPEIMRNVEIAYYQKVEPLGEFTTPIILRYPGVYLNCTLAAGAPYLIEDERLNTFSALATAGIKMANEQAIHARFSGSPIRGSRRSFG